MISLRIRMRKVVLVLKLILVSLLYTNAQIDQNVVILDMLSNDRETYMIDSYGKLIKTFHLKKDAKLKTISILNSQHSL